MSRRRPPFGPAQRPWAARRRCRPTASPARAKQRCPWLVTGTGGRIPWWSARHRAGSRGRWLFGFTWRPGWSVRVVRLSGARALRCSGHRVVGGAAGRVGGPVAVRLYVVPGLVGAGGAAVWVRVPRCSGPAVVGWALARIGARGCSTLRGAEAGRRAWCGCLGPGCRGARVPRWVVGCRAGSGGRWLFGSTWCRGRSARLVRLSGVRVPRCSGSAVGGGVPARIGARGCSALRGAEAGRRAWCGCLGPGCRGARVPRWVVGCRAGSGGWRVFGLTWCPGWSVRLVGDRSRGTGPGLVGGVPGRDEGPVAWQRAPTRVRVLGVTPP
ncbi:UNVERIFIED_CONTAM: hypothetical protein RKD50_004059 [Streptomyces canus]